MRPRRFFSFKATLTREALENDPEVQRLLASKNIGSISEYATLVLSVLEAARNQHNFGVLQELKKHDDYFRDKSGSGLKDIEAGRGFSISNKAYLMDFINNSLNVCAGFEQDSSSREIPISPIAKVRGQALPDGVVALIAKAETALEGWCTREKATILASLVLDLEPTTCVEIGVYGGRSLVPVAGALRHNGCGAVYGIETWSGSVATEFETSAENDQWWRTIDLNQIKRAFFRFVAENELEAYVKVVEASSALAATLFQSIDFLHIDGAHSVYNAAEDVSLYAKKVKRGGIIVLDDVDWPTTIPAQLILGSICDLIHEIKNDKDEVAVKIFRKR